MKLSVLVARYFYQAKELNLPGIGTFYLDEAVTVPDVSDKNFREFLKHIQFKQKNITKPDDGLIDYIRTHTGKIKPLAESDLDSYVSDGKVMLNIGKPFLVEGIGMLQKNKEGTFEFTPGEPTMEKFESMGQEKEVEKPSKKKSVFDENHEVKTGNRQRGLLIGVLVLIGLGVIVWGGYSLYNKNVQPTETVANNNNVTNTTDTSSQTPKDTVQNTTAPVTGTNANKDANNKDANNSKKDANKDSNSNKEKPKTLTGNLPAGMYKYILENCHKATALKRLADLGDKIKIETKDSVWFRVYMALPGTPADTARIRDSLHFWYWGDRPRKVTIEQ